MDGEIEIRGGRERRSKQLLDDLRETRGCCKLTEEALDLPSVENWLWKKAMHL